MQTIQLTTVIPEQLKGTRLDRALAELFPDYSRSRLKDWLTSGQITINGQSGEPKQKVQGGEHIEINAELTEQTRWEAQPIQLDIIHEDEALLIINKPAGLVVHPAAGNPNSTLVNALLHHVPELAQLPRAGLIHRIDKDTTGLLAIAKTLEAHTALVEQLQQKTLYREYEAVVTGVLTGGGTVNAPIGRHPKQRIRMAVVEDGKNAITHYRVLERFAHHTRIKVILETGRTHQIRVHMAHIHYPIVGDQTYAGRFKLPKGISTELAESLRNFKRQALHARKLGFIHPISKQEVQFEAKVPEDMQALIRELRIEN